MTRMTMAIWMMDGRSKNSAGDVLAARAYLN